MALVTTTQLKSRMPGYSGTSQDATLEDLIGLADALIATYIGLPLADSATVATLESATYTLRLDGPQHGERRKLELGVAPVISVTSIHQSLDWVWDATTLVPAADYELDKQDGIVWMVPNPSTHPWYHGRRVIRAIVVAGLTTPLADSHPMVDLVATTVRHLVDRQSLGHATSQSVGGQTVQPADTNDLLPLTVRRALAPWVLWGNRVC